MVIEADNAKATKFQDYCDQKLGLRLTKIRDVTRGYGLKKLLLNDSVSKRCLSDSLELS